MAPLSTVYEPPFLIQLYMRQLRPTLKLHPHNTLPRQQRYGGRIVYYLCGGLQTWRVSQKTKKMRKHERIFILYNNLSVI